MKTKNVQIGSDIYTLTALTCDRAGAISIDLISDLAPIVVGLVDGNVEVINKELRESINSEKLIRVLAELINPSMLQKNGSLIDWKEEFQCKPMTLFKLGIEALRFNCEDFFTSISGFVKEISSGQNWKEIVKNLEKEGVEIPQLFSLLLQNGETNEAETNK